MSVRSAPLACSYRTMERRYCCRSKKRSNRSWRLSPGPQTIPITANGSSSDSACCRLPPTYFSAGPKLPWTDGISMSAAQGSTAGQCRSPPRSSTAILRRPVRAHPGARPCAIGRRGRAFGLSRRQPRIRQGDRRIRGPVRTSNAAGLARSSRRDRRGKNFRRTAARTGVSGCEFPGSTAVEHVVAEILHLENCRVGPPR